MEKFVSYEKMSKNSKDSQRLQTRQLGKCEADYQGQGFGKNYNRNKSRTPETMAIVSGVLLFYKAGKCYEKELERMGKIFGAGAAA